MRINLIHFGLELLEKNSNILKYNENQAESVFHMLLVGSINHIGQSDNTSFVP